MSMEKIDSYLYHEVDAVYRSAINADPSGFAPVYGYALFLKNCVGDLDKAEKAFNSALKR